MHIFSLVFRQHRMRKRKYAPFNHSVKFTRQLLVERFSPDQGTDNYTIGGTEGDNKGVDLG